MGDQSRTLTPYNNTQVSIHITGLEPMILRVEEASDRPI
jgi:hypothetical protein